MAETHTEDALKLEVMNLRLLDCTQESNVIVTCSRTGGTIIVPLMGMKDVAYELLKAHKRLTKDRESAKDAGTPRTRLYDGSW